jgi:hypothetical protein
MGNDDNGFRDVGALREIGAREIVMKRAGSAVTALGAPELGGLERVPVRRVDRKADFKSQLLEPRADLRPD